MQPAHYQLVAKIDETHWWFLGRRAIVGAVVESVVPAGTGAVVVDVGCGPGANIASLADRYRTIGIDNSPDAIAHAARRFTATRFIEGLAPQDLPAGGREADAFLLMDVLEHVEDDAALLGALVGATRPGARFVITVPADPRLWSEQDERLGHHRRYDVDSLSALVRDLPLRVIGMSYFNSRLYPVVRAIRAVLRVVGRSFGDEGSDMTVARGLVNSALYRVFRGERGRVLGAISGRRRPYRAGVSLLLVAEVLEGPSAGPPPCPGKEDDL